MTDIIDDQAVPPAAPNDLPPQFSIGGYHGANAPNAIMAPPAIGPAEPSK